MKYRRTQIWVGRELERQRQRQRYDYMKEEKKPVAIKGQIWWASAIFRAPLTVGLHVWVKSNIE